MQFLWNGSTWTTSADDAPSNPIGVTTERGGGDIQRTYYGTARALAPRWSRRTFAFTWSSVGTTAPAVRCNDMITSGGTVTIACHLGTFITRPLADSFSWSETGYSIYDVTMSFAEV